MKKKAKVNASILIIGNEILSGRTQDTNTSTISKWLNSIGVSVAEVRIIPDNVNTIVKNRAASGWSWYLYHGMNTTAPETDNLYWNNSDGTLDDNTRWNDTAPTSTVITTGNNAAVNGNTYNYVAYCFAEIKGFSKFGKYDATGTSNDGPFIYTGFKPAFIITRRTSGATGDWQLYDNKRTPTNVADTILFPNGSTADSQADGYAMDILSNGFKIRTDNSNKNNSGSDYIYLAFAAEPLVSSNDIPATAR